MKFSTKTKNITLNETFRGRTLYVGVNGPVGSPTDNYELITFSEASNSLITNSAMIMFAVQADTVINTIWVRELSETGDLLATINLTGDDVQEYDDVGTYTINILRFGVGEV